MEIDNKKFLGEYYFTDIIHDGEEISVLMNEDDEDDWYPTELFQRMEAGSYWDGIATETNTSAIVIKISNCGDGGELWRIW